MVPHQMEKLVGEDFHCIIWNIGSTIFAIFDEVQN